MHKIYSIQPVDLFICVQEKTDSFLKAEISKCNSFLRFPFLYSVKYLHHIDLVNHRITESQNHRITEQQGLEGTSVSHLVQPFCRSRVTYSRLHRTASRRVLNISREGDSTTSLGSLFQCSVTLRVKKFFLMFRWNILSFSLCPLPLVLSLGTTEKSLAPSS